MRHLYHYEVALSEKNIHFMAEATVSEKEERISLGLGSECLVYSRSKKEWFHGDIAGVYVDKQNEEWLVVKYGVNQQKKIQFINIDLEVLTQ